ncbi:hypothetical protein L6252_02015, partial [Candidatus Parcubacteria bacterium]|nr:hypothetical protein [Candidatus Parcubacteria bacterium]
MKMKKSFQTLAFGFLTLAVLILGAVFLINQKTEAVGTKSLGEECTSSAECFSYYCNEGFCDCYANGYDNCYYPSHCCSGSCVDNTCGKVAGCQDGQGRCVESIVNNEIKGKIEKCVNGVWELQKQCLGNCAGNVCSESSEVYDVDCVESISGDNLIFKAQGTACNKDGKAGQCNGSGACFPGQGAPGGGSGGGGVSDSVCSAQCQLLGRQGGFCKPIDYYYQMNYCSGYRCLTNLLSPERAQIYCEGDYECQCYNLENKTCDPGCEQRCKGAKGCKPLNAENCCNNIDDDFDGMTDAQDSDCNQSKGTIALQAGANSACWQAKPWAHYLGSDSVYEYTSPTFACPSGYWLKPTGSYYILDFEELYAIYSGPGGVTLPYGYGTGTQLPVLTGSLSGIFPANKLSLKYTAGGQSSSNYSQDLGVAVSSLECVQYANIECGKCGDGIFWGLFNICDKAECSAISEGSCFFDPRGTGGHCYNKATVIFTLKDAVNKVLVAGAKVNIKDFDNITCTAGAQGTCSVELGL